MPSDMMRNSRFIAIKLPTNGAHHIRVHCIHCISGSSISGNSTLRLVLLAIPLWTRDIRI